MRVKRALGILFVLALILTPVALVAKAVHGGAPAPVIAVEPAAAGGQEPEAEPNGGWSIDGADDGEDREAGWDDDRSRPGFLGVEITALTPSLRRHFGADEDQGVLVSEIRADSAAEIAGLEVGDVVTRVNGEAIERSSDLRRAVRAAGAGSAVPVEVVRDGGVLTLEAVLGESPHRFEAARWERRHERAAARHAERAREHAARMHEHGERMREHGERLREQAEQHRDRLRERAERRHREHLERRGEWDDEEWEEFGRQWEDFGEHWAEWGERFGEQMGEHWELHGEELGRAIEEAMESVDWNDIGRSIEEALAAVDWESIGPEIDRSMEEAMRALDQLDLEHLDVHWDDHDDESSWDDDRDDRVRR